MGGPVRLLALPILARGPSPRISSRPRGPVAWGAHRTAVIPEDSGQ